MSKVLYAVSTGVDSRHLQDVTIHKKLSEAKEAYSKHLCGVSADNEYGRIDYIFKEIPK